MQACYSRQNISELLIIPVSLLRQLMILLLIGTFSIQVNGQLARIQKHTNPGSHTDSLMLRKFADSLNQLRQKDIKAAKDYWRQLMSDSSKYSSWVNGGLYEIIASMNWQEGQLPDGINNFRIARRYFLNSPDKARAAYNLSQIGVYQYYYGKKDSAINYYLRSIDELKNLPNAHFNALAHFNVGVYFSDLKNFEKASDYLSKATGFARSSKDSAVLINLLQTQGKNSMSQGQWNSACIKLRESLIYAKALNRKYLQAVTTNELSSVLLELKQYDSVIYFSKEAMKFADENNEIPIYIQASINAAAAYEALGNEAARIEILKKALAKEKEAGEITFGHILYVWLARASYQIGDYKRAYELMETVSRLRDSSMTVSSAKLNTELEVKYQTAQKEIAISQQRLELTKKDLQIQRSRSKFYYLLAGLLITTFLIVILYLQSRNKKLLHERELNSLNQQKEIQLLQALTQGEEKERNRIAKDLHDGVAGLLSAVKMHFSSLRSDGNELHKQPSFNQGMQLLNEATIEVRKTSHNLMPEVLFQHGLDSALNRYCNSISNSKLKIQYDVMGNISRFIDSFELSVYRMVQEILNNVIKHSNASEAVVQVSEQHNLLSITIEDNGRGIDQQKMDEKGMGLIGLQSRVKALNGKMDIQTGIDMGVDIYLEFDIEKVRKR
jgi:signal transduction histidine kinase